MNSCNLKNIHNNQPLEMVGEEEEGRRKIKITLSPSIRSVDPYSLCSWMGCRNAWENSGF